MDSYKFLIFFQASILQFKNSGTLFSFKVHLVRIPSKLIFLFVFSLFFASCLPLEFRGRSPVVSHGPRAGLGSRAGVAVVAEVVVRVAVRKQEAEVLEVAVGEPEREHRLSFQQKCTIAKSILKRLTVIYER
jgi:hypothetical protein